MSIIKKLQAAKLAKKDGKASAKFIKVCELISDAIEIGESRESIEICVHFLFWSGRGRHISIGGAAWRYHLENTFKAFGVAFDYGNDAPRGGATGDFIHISKADAETIIKFCESIK